MKVEILGSGGAVSTPRPACSCRVCAEARREGIPYSRGGPSLFVHGPDVLVDTPEDIKAQLNRSRIEMSYDDLLKLSERLQTDGVEVALAYDTLLVDV